MPRRPLVQYSSAADESATVAVVRALSEANGGDPFGDATIHDDVDSDALDALMDADIGAADARVAFETAGFLVAVSTVEDGVVTVYDAETE